jgi:PAS domain S-box-containing protein
VRPSPLATVVRATLLGVAYFAAVRVATAISIPGVSIAPIRLPNALAITALLFAPPSTWWVYLIAIAPRNVIFSNPAVSVLYMFANSLEIVVAAAAIRAVTRTRPALDGLRECLVFVAIAVVVAPIVAGLIGAFAVMRLYPAVPFVDSWRVWALGDGVGNVALVPALLALAALPWRQMRPHLNVRVLEAAAIAVGIVVSTVPTLGVFGVAPPGSTAELSLLYVPFPMLIWAGLRFGAGGAAAANLLVAILSTVSALTGRGPFSQPDNPSGVLLLQQFLVVTGATTVTLAGVADERHRTLAALQLSEDKFHRAFQASPDAIAISALATGRFIDVNEGFVRLGGYAREEVIGRTSLELGLWADPEQRASVVQALREGRGEGLLTRLRARSGQVKVVLVSGAAIDVEGEMCVVVIMRDITERREIEAALQDSESRYRSLFDTASDVVVTTDLAGTMETANLAFETISGWTRDDWFGRPITTFLDPAQAPAALQRLADIVGGGVSKPQPWRVRTKQGDWKITEVKASLFSRGGRPAGLLFIARDITERQRAEEERARFEDEIAQARKLEAVGQLAGGIAHDFNNILQAILGFADLARTQVPEESRAITSLEKIVRAAERARDLTQQLLTFSRRETVSPKVLDLAATVGELSQILRRVLPANVSLQVSSEPDTPPVFIDRGHVDQVVMNLCLNARDAMPHGGTISVTIGTKQPDAAFVAEHTGARAGRFVTLRVSDDGEGIPPDLVSRIFEPFFTTKDIGQGTGLGLATVYAIVKRYSGLIDVQTSVGKGTTFTIYLPPSEVVAAAAVTPTAPKTASGHGELILIAEDEELVRELAVQLLERAGYRVIAAHDGAHALQLFAEHGRDVRLVVLDLMMPNGDGRAVRRSIKERRPDVPVLFATGYADRDRLGRLQEAITDPLIEKPYDPSTLLTAVRTILDGSAVPPRFTA